MHDGPSTSGDAAEEFISLAKTTAVRPFGGRRSPDSSASSRSNRGHYGPPKHSWSKRPFSRENLDARNANEKADADSRLPSDEPRNHKIVVLHKEIEDFFRWIMPNRKEHEVRLAVIDRVKQSIHSVFPDSKVDVFGSSRTGLYLPTSDIDLVVYGKWDTIPFSAICSALLKRSVCMPGSLKVLERATVPIIKLADRLTGFSIDISFNLVNGLRAAELIKFYKGQYPAMAKLVYVVKQFLMQRNLNEVYSGGLSSYALILMVVSFLQRHARDDARSAKTNMAVLLIEFFELYGVKFNYAHNGIRVAGGGSYVRKDQTLCYQGPGNPGTICIEDPFDPQNDVGRSSYGFPTVKRAFEQAYFQLVNMVTHSGPDESPAGILGYIVCISGAVCDFRYFISTLEVNSECQQGSEQPRQTRQARRRSRPAQNSNSARSSSSESSENEASRVSRNTGLSRLDR